MSPSVAIKRVFEEKMKRPNLQIAAISGPGEPLANRQTFETFRGIRALDKNIEFCLSTNGVLLEQSANQLKELDVKVITISIHTVNTKTATKIYDWAIYNKKKLYGIEMAKYIINQQIKGIQTATKIGIKVKANSILIPGINDKELENLAMSLVKNGVEIQNIVPLVPYDKMSNIRAPNPEEIIAAKKRASQYLMQFDHCAQCRSDIVGIPGKDTIL
jgi:nitrogen fixation protein NifB